MADLSEGRAGMFNCAGPCQRKRLVAGEFSRKMVEVWQGDDKAPIYCKKCTLEKEAEKAKEANTKADSSEMVVCSECKKELPSTAYSNKQLRKELTSKNLQKCKECVFAAEKAQRENAAVNKEAKLKMLRAEAEELEKKGDKIKAMKIFTEAASLEAEIHSGVKAMKPKPFKPRRR
eukprot:TRINITY_DN23122_c0_g1_i1.p1 TRINITY_DN23122_c0_g1~~TRINITY_DN23122_c0_g1_i1.p1  ORF type:complete len:190 (+),score=68.07 TRINITY_DN23122_c0_g1_i1:45-572(+)